MVSMTGMNALKFESLPDGLIVSKGDTINIIEGEWTLLLTIQESGVRHQVAAHTELVTRAQELWNTVIDVQAIAAFFTNERKALMRAKVDLVVGAGQELQYNITARRDRRGVIDFIGEGLSWAFGMATQSQVDQLTRAVNAARTSQNAVVHNNSELITVVNQTQLEGIYTRRKLATLSDSYDRFVENESNRWGRYGRCTRLLMM